VRVNLAVPSCLIRVNSMASTWVQVARSNRSTTRLAPSEENSASQAATASNPWDQATPAHRARHPGPRPGLARPRQDPSAQGAVARLRAPVRPGAHHPLRQADPWLDHAQGAPSRAGRPLDLAGAGRLHPAASGPHDHLRPAAAMGTTPRTEPAQPLPSAPRVPQPRCTVGSPTKSPKPCGRSPGRPTGSRTGPARRYPTIKKAA
jgi:hypothetical protein